MLNPVLLHLTWSLPCMRSAPPARAREPARAAVCRRPPRVQSQTHIRWTRRKRSPPAQPHTAGRAAQTAWARSHHAVASYPSEPSPCCEAPRCLQPFFHVCISSGSGCVLIVFSSGEWVVQWSLRAIDDWKRLIINVKCWAVVKNTYWRKLKCNTLVHSANLCYDFTSCYTE